MASLRSLRPDRMTLDRGTEHWRGARLVAVNGASSTVRVLRIGASLIADVVVSTSLIPVDARAIGQPLCVRLDHADMTTVLEIVGSTWPPGDAPLNEVAAAAGPGTHCGCVPRAIHGEPLIWWEA